MDGKTIPLRLNKYLALQRGISRREADDLIAAGRVEIDGITAVLGARYTPDNATGASTIISVDNLPIGTTVEKKYILFHKPVGYISSRRAQDSNPTIYELLPKVLYDLKPAGRLDKDSSGLMLLTNDGDSIQTLTHPRFSKQKQYEITLDDDLAPLHQQMISDHGIQLDDGNSRLILERICDENRSEWKVMMHEGRNRQIRRTFAALGYTVIRLHRTHLGPYALGDIPEGKYTSIDIK